MIVRFKKLSPLAVLPAYAHESDAGLDLVSIGYEPIQKGGVLTYHTGLAVEIPDGHVGLLFPRSSVCKKDLCLANCVGVIDSGYRGEILVKFRATDPFHCEGYAVGEKVAQLIVMPYPKVEVEECNELTDTERGDGGFGSTGR